MGRGVIEEVGMTVSTVVDASTSPAQTGMGSALPASSTAVMLKTYRNFNDIYRALEELNLLDRAVYVGRCGLDQETVIEDLRTLKEEKTPYLSLIIIKKQGIDSKRGSEK